MTMLKQLLNGKTWPTVFALSVLAMIGGVAWGVNRTAVDYGPPEASELHPKVVQPGDVVQACFNSITWYTPAPSIAPQWFECMKRLPDGKLRMTRFDMQERIVKYPSKPGKLPPKCRPIANQNDEPYPVPDWCAPGPLRYGGEIRVSTLWGLWTRVYDFPPNMVAEVRARP